MAQLKQVQMAYGPVEDRIVLRISTGAGDEFRFWLTRRYSLLLWQVLLKAAGQDPAVATQASPAARDAVLSFRHEDAVGKADFSQPFRNETPTLPLGEAPVLLSKIRLRELGDGRSALCLHPEQAQGIDITLDAKLLHSLTRLLADTVAKADWGITLTLPGAQAAGADSDGRRLN